MGKKVGMVYTMTKAQTFFIKVNGNREGDMDMG
jgi:hypothetical protein